MVTAAESCLDVWYQDNTTRCQLIRGHEGIHRSTVYPKPYLVQWGKDSRKSVAKKGFA